MEKFVPHEKLSKKKKRELAAARRVRWARSPVTRRPANPKAYDRRKARKEAQDDPSVLFYPLRIAFRKGKLALIAAGKGPLWSARGLALLVSGCF